MGWGSYKRFLRYIWENPGTKTEAEYGRGIPQSSCEPPDMQEFEPGSSGIAVIVLSHWATSPAP